MTTKNVIDATELANERLLNMLVYGPPGIGKTTFCETAPKPFLIDVDFGAISISDSKRIKIKQCETMQQIMEGISIAINENFETVIIDSLTRFTEILGKEIMNENKITKLRIQDYGDILNRTSDLLWRLKQKKINTIFCCHEKETETEDGIFKRPLLGGQMISKIPLILDVVGYLKIDRKGERTLGVIPTHSYYAKNRSTLSRPITTDLAPNFNVLLDAVYGEVKEVKNAPAISK